MRERVLRAAVVTVVAALAVAVLLAVLHAQRTVALPPPPGGAVPLSQASPPPTTRSPAPLPAGPDRPAPAATSLSTFWGIDVSWPQCGAAGLPEITTGFVTVGVNDGKPFTDNPCLAAEVAYARTHSGYSAYLNVDAPRGGDPAAYGRREGLDGLARARRAGLRPPVIWLDVETLNHWSADPTTNAAVIGAAARAIERRHVRVGIYSSGPMWQRITAGADPGRPVWLATSVTDYRTLDPLCAAGLGGRAAVLGQYVASASGRLVDVDVLCTATRSASVSMFAAGNG